MNIKSSQMPKFGLFHFMSSAVPCKHTTLKLNKSYDESIKIFKYANLSAISTSRWFLIHWLIEQHFKFFFNVNCIIHSFLIQRFLHNIHTNLGPKMFKHKFLDHNLKVKLLRTFLLSMKSEIHSSIINIYNIFFRKNLMLNVI